MTTARHRLATSIVSALSLGLALSACASGGGSAGSDSEGNSAADCRAAFKRQTVGLEDVLGPDGYAEARSNFVGSCTKSSTDPDKLLAKELDKIDAEFNDAFGTTDEPREPDAPRYDESQVVDFLDLTKGGVETSDSLYGEWTYHAGDLKCGISQIFTAKGIVDTYDDVQNDVAVTPEGNVGVEVSGPSLVKCFPVVEKALSGFEPAMAQSSD